MSTLKVNQMGISSYPCSDVWIPYSGTCMHMSISNGICRNVWIKTIMWISWEHLVDDCGNSLHISTKNIQLSNSNEGVFCGQLFYFFFASWLPCGMASLKFYLCLVSGSLPLLLLQVLAVLFDAPSGPLEFFSSCFSENRTTMTTCRQVRKRKKSQVFVNWKFECFCEHLVNLQEYPINLFLGLDVGYPLLDIGVVVVVVCEFWGAQGAHGQINGDCWLEVPWYLMVFACIYTNFRRGSLRVGDLKYIVHTADGCEILHQLR